MQLPIGCYASDASPGIPSVHPWTIALNADIVAQRLLDTCLSLLRTLFLMFLIFTYHSGDTFLSGTALWVDLMDNLLGT